MLSFINNLKKVRGLQDLCLQFSGLFHLTDSVLLGLSESLKRLTKLRTFGLHLSRCFNGITTFDTNGHSAFDDIGLLALIQALGKHTEIQSLFLGFYKCEGVQENAIIELNKTLKKLKSLQNITLKFSECLDLTNQVFSDLSKSLAELVSLKRIELNFAKCDQLLDQGLSVLGSSFKKLKSLETIVLDFKSCENLTQEGREDLKKDLNEIDTLKEAKIYILKGIWSKGTQKKWTYHAGFKENSLIPH